MSEERLMKTPEEVRQKARELLQMPKEEVLTKYMFQEQKIERLNNIIKEVREYIKNTMEVDEEYPDYMTFEICEYQELLDILDKAGD